MVEHGQQEMLEDWKPNLPTRPNDGPAVAGLSVVPEGLEVSVIFRC